MWPLWPWLPWFSAAQPRAAPHSTLPLVSPALQDPCTTTVSPALPSPPSCIVGWRAAMCCWAGNAKVDGLSFSADTLMCSCCSVPGQCLFPGACLPCAKGFYQPLSGQQQCWPCNRGYYAKYTHCAHLVTGDSGACFVCFTGIPVLTVSLGVLYATPARLVPSTTTPEQTVARVARQVCLLSAITRTLPGCFTRLMSKSAEAFLVCCSQVSIPTIRVPPRVRRARWEASASKLAATRKPQFVTWELAGNVLRPTSHASMEVLASRAAATDSSTGHIECHVDYTSSARCS